MDEILRYHNITKHDMLNGPGLRVVLWVAGCGHHCDGCQNPITWDSNGGIRFDSSAAEEIYNELSKDYCSGITYSGGDPLFLPGTRRELTLYTLAASISTLFPTKTQWLYTGYLWEQVRDLPIMQYLDVVVDGKFDKNLADVSYHWAGSTNQRVIDVKKSLEMGEIVLFEEENNDFFDIGIANF